MKQLLNIVNVFACAVMALQAEDTKEFKIGGAATFIEPVVKNHQTEIEKEIGTFKLKPFTHNAGAGFKMFLDDELDLTITAGQLEAMKKNDKVKDHQKLTVCKDNLKEEEIAKGKIVVVVHPSNKIEKLSKEQLAGIFSGKIKNWKEVDGEDKDIVVVSGKNIGIQKTIEEKLLDKSAVVQNIGAENPIDVVKLVSKKETAIGFYGDVLPKETKKFLEENKVKVADTKDVKELELKYTAVYFDKLSEKQKKVLDALKKFISENGQ